MHLTHYLTRRRRTHLCRENPCIRPRLILGPACSFGQWVPRKGATKGRETRLQVLAVEAALITLVHRLGKVEKHQLQQTGISLQGVPLIVVHNQ